MKEQNKHPEYYEAILQIRPAKREILDLVFDLIKNRNDVRISKIDELKNGFDVYLTNQKWARGALAQQLKRKFKNGKLLVTKTLYGRHKMTSKLIYRATVLFRLN